MLVWHCRWSLYENSLSSNKRLKFGTYPGTLLFIQVGLNIGYGNYSPRAILNTYLTFFKNMIDIGSENSQLFANIDNYSKGIIAYNLSIFIFISSCYCFTFIILYALIYFPFLKREQKKIQEIEELSKIIISEGIAENPISSRK